MTTIANDPKFKIDPIKFVLGIVSFVFGIMTKDIFLMIIFSIIAAILICYSFEQD